MNRVAVSFNIDDYLIFTNKLLQWCNQFQYSVFLNSNQNKNHLYQRFEILAAVSNQCIHFETENIFDQLKYHYDKKIDLFGYLSYDLKDNSYRENKNITIHDLIFLFEPEIKIEIFERVVIITTVNNHDQIFNSILDISLDNNINILNSSSIEHSTSKKEYVKNVESIKNQIINGDFYELNYCIEFKANNIKIDPVNTYRLLNSNSEAPFSAFVKNNFKYIICSSPERFVTKLGSRLISQPIKGTAKRNHQNHDIDETIKSELFSSEKERAENLMIVDLVRNDLNISSNIASVEVTELCKVYSYKQVHQLISTIESELDTNIHPIDALKKLFPMGSMTGAPKVEVMSAIEKYENTDRGIYSGSIGYINKNGDFDFNVIIRSIIYDDKKNNLSFHAGSAITYDSEPNDEYSECLLKAKALSESIVIK